MPGEGEAESFVSWEEWAPARIRRNGMEPTGNNGPTLSESVNFLLSSMCLFVSRIAKAVPKPFFFVSYGVVDNHSLSLGRPSSPSW